MTTWINEHDGGRAVEVEVRNGIVYIDSPRSCYAFDRRQFLRAVEREFDVIICDPASTFVAGRKNASGNTQDFLNATGGGGGRF